ncbi:MAG: radical SAM/SPASM domain-containing protein, partial [Rubripirellula sp.]
GARTEMKATRSRSARTIRPQPFALVPQHFGSMLFDRQRVQYFPFDHDASELLELWTRESCDGIIGEQKDEQRRSQIAGFAEHLLREGILSCDGRLDAKVLKPAANSRPTTSMETKEAERVGQTHLTGPLVTHVEIVGACNITCTHCFAGDLPRNQNPLTLDELDTLFRDLASIGCFRVSLTGGEPLLRHDLFEIIDSATSHQLHATVTTNGTLITKAVAEQFGTRPGVRVNLSLEGSTAASNDSVRGAGTFDQVCEKAALLRPYADFTIGFTITRQNAAEAEACASLAKRLGARAAVFRPLFPVGVAQRHPSMMPSFDEYVDTLKTIAGCDTIESPALEGNSMCAAGRLLASVSAQGDVNACGFLGEKYAVENIRNRLFSEIWNDSDSMHEFRHCEGDASDQNDGTNHFQGGCRARALAANGDVNAVDPWHEQYESEPLRHFFPISNLSVTRG